MTDIWLLTSAFPYEPGEQFLETEVAYWAQLRAGRLTLFPSQVAGKPRALPPGLAVDHCLAARSPGARLSSLGAALRSPLLWRELRWLRQRGMLSPRNASLAWRMAAAVLRTYSALKQRRRPAHGGRVVAYSYWFDVSAYAAALLRREGLVDRLVTRAHGTDVYEDRRPRSYMPLKRQLADAFDLIFAVSEEGRSYLQARYAISAQRLRVARLGVAVGDQPSAPSPPGRLEILSVSSCTPIKRIDRMVDALALAARKAGGRLAVNWVHIGDGSLRPELQARAAAALGQLAQVSYRFLGHLPHDQVLQYLATHAIDVFLNSSESEGVPVAIMEAMSCGIPAIAPAVGGIPELVDSANGWLLSARPTIAELAAALLLGEHYKGERTRAAARQTIQLHYDAARNYPAFVNAVVNPMGATR